MSTTPEQPGHPQQPEQPAANGQDSPTQDLGHPYAAPPTPPYNAWQDAYAAEPQTIVSPERRRASPRMRVVALVAAAAVAGGGVTYALTHDSSGGTSPVASAGVAGQQQPGTTGQQGQGAPPGQGQDDQGQGQGRGFGGVDGEQRVVGVLSAVGSSSITLRTSSGTATYPVTSATEIAKDGALASLSDLSSGDTVLVHLVPPANGSTDTADLTVERIIVGSGGPGLGGPGPDDNGGDNGGGQDDGSGTSTVPGLDT